jgi:YfiH family protein
MRWITPDWPTPPGVKALSTLRVGGASLAPYESLNLGDHVGDAAEAVAANRQTLRAAAALPAEPDWLVQVHGARVRNLDEPAPAAAAHDGAVTRTPGRICAILTADCLPVLLAAEDGSAVGAAHAGWRGLAGGVIEAAVQALGVPPPALLAWLGPAIGPGAFEVGPEVREAFLAAAEGAAGAGVAGPGTAGKGAHAASVAAAFAPNACGRFLADLYQLARLRLERLGITRIYGGGACTFTESAQYFSHRRDGRTGRQATLIWRETAAIAI